VYSNIKKCLTEFEKKFRYTKKIESFLKKTKLIIPVTHRVEWYIVFWETYVSGVRKLSGHAAAAAN